MKKTSGITLIETVVAAGLLGLLAIGISKTQIFTTSQLGKAEFSTVMDSFHLTATTGIQSVNGLREIRSWVETNQPELKNCLERNHVNCLALNNTSISLAVSTTPELNSIEFDRNGSVCVGTNCAGRTSVNIIPDCQVDTKCDGIKVRALTEDLRIGTNAKVSDKKSDIYFSGLKLFASAGIDFSCAESGAPIMAIDPVNRKAICLTNKVVECQDGVPGSFSGIGTLGTSPCKKMLNFEEKEKRGLGKNTTTFNPGYKKIGIKTYVTPDEELPGALAQEACGLTILRRVSMRVGQSFAGTGTCPNSTTQQKTMYRGEEGRLSMNDDALEGFTAPDDPDIEKEKWGYSQGKEWDFLFKNPSRGYSNVEWHLLERCCRDKDDVWALEQVASNFSETVDYDPYSMKVIMKDMFVIDDDEQATSTHRILGRDSSVIWSQTVDVLEVGSKKLSLDYIRMADAVAVPGSTPLGISNVSNVSGKIHRERVIEPTNESEPNNLVYTINTVTGTTAIESSSRESRSKITLKFTNNAGSVIKTVERSLFTSDAKVIDNINPTYTGIYRVSVEPSGSSTPSGIVDTRSVSGGLVQTQIQENGISPAPTETREYLVRIQNPGGSGTMRTERLTLSPGDRVRVDYNLEYTYDLVDPEERPYNYQVKDKDGNPVKEVLVQPGERVRITSEFQPRIVDNTP